MSLSLRFFVMNFIGCLHFLRFYSHAGWYRTVRRRTTPPSSLIKILWQFPTYRFIHSYKPHKFQTYGDSVYTFDGAMTACLWWVSVFQQDGISKGWEFSGCFSLIGMASLSRHCIPSNFLPGLVRELISSCLHCCLFRCVGGICGGSSIVRGSIYDSCEATCRNYSSEITEHGMESKLQKIQLSFCPSNPPHEISPTLVLQNLPRWKTRTRWPCLNRQIHFWENRDVCP